MLLIFAGINIAYFQEHSIELRTKLTFLSDPSLLLKNRGRLINKVADRNLHLLNTVEEIYGSANNRKKGSMRFPRIRFGKYRTPEVKRLCTFVQPT